MKVTIEAGIGTDKRGEFFQHQLVVDGEGMGRVTRYYYEEVDKLLIEKMPKKQFDNLVDIINTERTRRLTCTNM